MTLLSELWDTTRMRLLVEIERGGSLSAAARAVGIGQPSASQHLRNLEAAAGQRLVERNRRGSRLTQGGRVLAAHAAQALATLSAGEQELNALAGLPTGTVASAFHRPRLLSSARHARLLPRGYPNVDVEMGSRAAERSSAASSRGVEIAIVGVDKADERIALEPFLADEIVGSRPGVVQTKEGDDRPKRRSRS